jgi:hypothetical protein
VDHLTDGSIAAETRNIVRRSAAAHHAGDPGDRRSFRADRVADAVSGPAAAAHSSRSRDVARAGNGR